MTGDGGAVIVPLNAMEAEVVVVVQVVSLDVVDDMEDVMFIMEVIVELCIIEVDVVMLLME